ncbi:hypothetical protein OEZ86_009481 [Tetradesmus obliquus]|nr:hypothetical protein OEZ86_009481 [Tetradesmus obliquus]
MINVTIRFGPTRYTPPTASAAVRGAVDNSSWQTLLFTCGQLGGAECTDVLLVEPNGTRVPLGAANLAGIGEGAELFGVVKAASQTLGRDTFNTRIDSVEGKLRKELQEVKEDLTKKLEAAQQGSLPSRPASVVQFLAKCLVVVGGAAVERHVNGSWPILSMCFNVVLAGVVLCAWLPRPWAARIFRTLNTLAVVPASN